jgi:hypothetical protein
VVEVAALHTDEPGVGRVNLALAREHLAARLGMYSPFLMTPSSSNITSMTLLAWVSVMVAMQGR